MIAVFWVVSPKMKNMARTLAGLLWETENTLRTSKQKIGAIHAKTNQHSCRGGLSQVRNAGRAYYWPL
jgi:hypothetical protein